MLDIYIYIYICMYMYSEGIPKNGNEAKLSLLGFFSTALFINA